MGENRISHLRKTKGLTQRALAEKVGTSQQQIQRIEAGVIAVRLELALRIADALATRLADVFPKLARNKSEKKQRKFAPSQAELSLAGIDPDPSHWTVKFFMHDGRQFLFRVSSSDKDRLESIAQNSGKSFFVFNSHDKCIALNRTKVAACQFLFDFFMSDKPEAEEQFKLTMHLIATKETISFDVEPDTKTPLEDELGSESQLQSLFSFLDEGDDDEVVWFDDEDGERVYIRSNELLLLEAPLICCEPELWEKSLEDETEKPEISNTESKS